MHDVNANDFFRPVLESLVRNAGMLLRFAGIELSPVNIMRVIRSAPTATTDLSDNNVGERSFCMNHLLRLSDGELYGDPELEAVADYFLEELPMMAPGSRRLLEEAASGVLNGLKAVLRACDKEKTARIGIHQPALIPRRKGGCHGQRKVS